MPDQRHIAAQGASVSTLLGEALQALASLREITREIETRVHWLEDSAAIRPPVRDAVEADWAVLDIRCFGPFELRRNGEPVHLPSSARALSVVRVLADQGGRPTTREAIAGRLWPGAPTGAADGRLRVAIHTLRRQLPEGPELIVFEDGSYRLGADRISIDVDRFEALVAAGNAAERAGDLDAALSPYGQAADLYRGDYLEDEPFEDWPQFRRAELRDTYLNVLTRLALRGLERRDDYLCIKRAHDIIKQDDCNEDAYRLLMLAHGLRGNRARALRWYDLCALTLRREFDADPSPATRRLREQILAGLDDSCPPGDYLRLNSL
jgi:DNA-binding SARP family transcriptional activator